LAVKIYILDGYNVIHAVGALENQLDRSLRAAREALVRDCADLCAKRKDISRIYIVFDGKDEFADKPLPGCGPVTILFTSSREEADERIVGILRRHAMPQSLRIVSNDNYVENHARAFGVARMSVAEFYGLFDRKTFRKDASPAPRHKQGLSARHADEITAAYKRHLGIR
jgi:predicted RNA-binding protein with PIN domain